MVEKPHLVLVLVSLQRTVPLAAGQIQQQQQARRPATAPAPALALAVSGVVSAVQPRPPQHSLARRGQEQHQQQVRAVRQVPNLLQARLGLWAAQGRLQVPPNSRGLGESLSAPVQTQLRRQARSRSRRKCGVRMAHQVVMQQRTVLLTQLLGMQRPLLLVPLGRLMLLDQQQGLAAQRITVVLVPSLILP